jgi:3-oxoadipate enol-lactonase
MRRHPLVASFLSLVASAAQRITPKEDCPEGAVASGRRAARDPGFVPVPGGRLYHDLQGAGDPIVLIHGNAGDHRHWDLQTESLALHFRVVRYDVRGFGKSSAPVIEQPYSNREDLLALLDHLGIRRAHVMGWSMGSGIAIDFVLAHPERVRSLISVGPWINGYGSPRVQSLLADFGPIGDAMARGGRAAAVDAWMSAPFFRSTIRDPASGARFREISADYSFWHFGRRDPARTLTPAAAGRTTEISVPTLVVTAEYDIPACIEMADLLARSVPRARQVIMPGVGHLHADGGSN